MTDPRYPIGKFRMPQAITAEDVAAHIETIAELPVKFRAAADGLSPEQLDTPYREGGWTVRQVLHHVPDSHINAYVRMKLALTEEEPLIKPYKEAEWAKLPDSAITPVETSLTLLTILHERWVNLMRVLTPGQWKRTYRHPEMGVFTLETQTALYAWHSRHHTAHITELRARLGW